MSEIETLKQQIRARLVQASEEDNCGGDDAMVDGYRWCGKELLAWWDRGMRDE